MGQNIGKSESTKSNPRFQSSTPDNLGCSIRPWILVCVVGTFETFGRWLSFHPSSINQSVNQRTYLNGWLTNPFTFINPTLTNNYPSPKVYLW